MKILSISNMDIWPQGEHKGIPSIFSSQKRFAQRGYVVYFLCPAGANKSGPVDYQGIKIVRFAMPFEGFFSHINSLRLDKFFPHLLSSIFSNMQWFLFQILSFFWALKIGLVLKPDIIYVHGLIAAFSAAAVSRILKARLVVRVYGTRDLYWLLKNPLARIKEFRDYLAFKVKADYFIITKDGTRGELLAKSLGVKEERIISYRNGIDPEMFIPDFGAKDGVRNELGVLPKTKIILSLARLIPFYAVESLVFALPEVFRLYPDCACIIAGDGPGAAAIKEFVIKNNIQRQVYLLGWRQRDEIRQLLKACDVYVSLSKYSNTNNSLFEAMASARCIVSLKDETISDVLTNNENAILFEAGDIAKLPVILSEILNDDARRDALGNKALERARELLEPWQERIDKEALLLENLLKLKKGS